MNELEARTNEARQVLREMTSTLATLTELTRRIRASLCTDTDLATLYSASADLELVEDRLADLAEVAL